MNVSQQSLYRKISITANARFHAATRLRNNGWFSQWTLATLAVGQIVISLISALDMASVYGKDYQAFGSIFFGILVLAYSLLLGMSDFNSRAVLFHECGLELNRLKQDFFYDNNADIEDWKIRECVRKYNDILGKYENHAQIDYLFAKIRHEEKGSNKYFLNISPKRFIAYMWHFLQVSHYIFSVLLIAGWIYVGVSSCSSESAAAHQCAKSSVMMKN